MNNYIGIDLGTSNSTVSVINENNIISEDIVEAINTLPIYQLDEEGQFLKHKITLPSTVYFDLDKEIIYTGEYAKAIYATGNKPMQTVKSIKTRIGGETIIEVPYIKDKSKKMIFDVTETSALLLRTIRESTEEQLGEIVESAVVTVPAAFNNEERQAVRNSMKLAKFKNVEILDEPTAVLLYDVNKNNNSLFALGDKENYLIYDIGGGTLDVTIATISKGEKVNIDILARSPRRNFGGDDFDKYLAAYMLADFEKAREAIEDKSIEDQHMIIARIVSGAEKYKIEINDRIRQAGINEKKIKRIKSFVNFEVIGNMKVSDVKLDKEIIENLFSILINDESSDLIEPIKESLNYAKMNKKNINKIILTGGSADFFIVEKAIKNFFGENINIRYVTEMAAVSKGAAIYNYHINGGDCGIALSVEDKMADDIYIKEKGSFRKIIDRTAVSGNKGKFYLEILEENQCEIGLFMYYGTDNNPENYSPIKGKFISLIIPKNKGDKIEVNWSINKDKTIKFFINELNEELELQSINSYKEKDIEENKINKFSINIIK